MLYHEAMSGTSRVPPARHERRRLKISCYVDIASVKKLDIRLCLKRGITRQYALILSHKAPVGENLAENPVIHKALEDDFPQHQSLDNSSPTPKQKCINSSTCTGLLLQAFVGLKNWRMHQIAALFPDYWEPVWQECLLVRLPEMRHTITVRWNGDIDQITSIIIPVILSSGVLNGNVTCAEMTWRRERITCWIFDSVLYKSLF